MLKLILCAALAASVAGAASAQTYVNGYTKSDGTYVQGHYRSEPNGTKSDNYSTKGNVNPYTGQAGTKQDDYGYNYTAPKSNSASSSSTQSSYGSNTPSNSSYGTTSKNEKTKSSYGY